MQTCTVTPATVLYLQGPLCQYALDALESIINFAANSAELQQRGGPAVGLAGLSSPATQGAGAPARPSVDLHGLAACLLPQLDVVELLQRVLESFGGPPRRKKQRLLPFLADSHNSSSGHQVDRILDE